ncbi:MAG TPA: ABC transporter substrate-binding protein [Eubacteriaceae bacterium]|jgi:iron complex transport system substrate-binding protein|nr:ABC transporter substrate-binding protein [Eubacteriaceae bacterium]
MKNWKKVFMMVLVLSLVTMMFIGCQQPAVQEDPEDNSEGVEEPEKITVTDVTGRELTFDKPATKVVGTHNPSLNAVVVLGGGDKYIVGFGNKEMSRGLYERVIDDFDDLIQIGKGKNINLETVVSTGADLAVIPERFKDQVEEYEGAGVTGIVALPNKESFETIKNTLRMLGKVLGENERAESIIEFFEEKIAKAKEASSKATEKQRVLFLGGSSPLSVAPSAMVQTELIEAAGGINAVEGVDVTGDFVDVNIEQIIEWNPDVIWYPAYTDYTSEDLINDPAWSSINAIKNKAVYQFPSALEPWDQPTAAIALGVSWATHSLHPELHSLEDLKKDADEFYNLVYGKTFTLEEMGLK